MDQRRLSGGFCLNSLSILSVESVEWTGRIGLNSLRTKITFFSLAGHHRLFCYHMYWCGDTQHPGCCSLPYDSPLLLQSGCAQKCAPAHGGQTSPRSPSLGGILEGHSVARQVASEKEKNKKKSGKGFNGEELDFNLGCHQVYPCASPPHLDGRTRRGEEGACVGKGQTKSDREGKLQGKVSLHPHLEQGGMAPVKKKKKPRL